MKIAIIGGGAAGMMTAATVIENSPGIEVFLIEKNNAIGKKVLLTGGGRCNVTTGLQNTRDVLKKYPRGSKFLNSAMRNFSPEAVYEWFEDHGVPLKTEDDQRVFPQSDDGQDIVSVFEKLFVDSNVKLLLNTQVVQCDKVKNGFSVYLKNQKAPLEVDRLVITTGGRAHKQTGSSGDGYALAEVFGHTITPLAPSISSFTVSQKWPARVSGVSFKKAKITATESKASYTGPFLFTHQGVSGPAIFALSALVAYEPVGKKEPLEISIDLFPDKSQEELYDQLWSVALVAQAKSCDKVLTGVIPKSLIEVAIQTVDLPWHKPLNEVGKKDIRTLTQWLKGISLKVIARGGGSEFVTAGGVDLTEVNPSTMESTIVSGLFFAGELLDIDAFTGGFNLQSAWCTGRLAGEKVGQE